MEGPIHNPGHTPVTQPPMKPVILMERPSKIRPGVRAISSLAETRDHYTGGYQRRVADLARAIASEMGLPTDQIDGIRRLQPSTI